MAASSSSPSISARRAAVLSEAAALAARVPLSPAVARSAQLPPTYLASSPPPPADQAGPAAPPAPAPGKPPVGNAPPDAACGNVAAFAPPPPHSALVPALARAAEEGVAGACAAACVCRAWAAASADASAWCFLNCSWTDVPEVDRLTDDRLVRLVRRAGPGGLQALWLGRGSAGLSDAGLAAALLFPCQPRLRLLSTTRCGARLSPWMRTLAVAGGASGLPLPGAAAARPPPTPLALVAAALRALTASGVTFASLAPAAGPGGGLRSRRAGRFAARPRGRPHRRAAVLTAALCRSCCGAAARRVPRAPAGAAVRSLGGAAGSERGASG